MARDSSYISQGQEPRDRSLQLETFLEGREYAGATAFLTFQRREAGADSKTLEWLAYSQYHNWEHAQVTPKYCCTCLCDLQ